MSAIIMEKINPITQPSEVISIQAPFLIGDDILPFILLAERNSSAQWFSYFTLNEASTFSATALYLFASGRAAVKVTTYAFSFLMK